MANKDTMNAKLDEMLQIIQGNDTQEMTMEKHQLFLVNEKGNVNEAARAQLVALICDVKEEMAKTTETNSWFGGYFDKKKVHIFIPIQTSTTKSFETDITKLLNKLSVKCEIWHKVSALRNDAPLIVVCPVTSRLEPDIDHALEGLNWPSIFAALVLHATRESSLPRLPTATRFDADEKYKNIEFIDVAFTSEEKMYKCQMNTDAKNKLGSFINNFFKK